MGRPPSNWDEIVNEVWKQYTDYGVVNGVGWTLGINGNFSLDSEATDAIGIYFEELNENVNLDMIPKEYQGYQVVPRVIGKLTLEGASNG